MNRDIIFDLDGTLITCETKQKFVLKSILSNQDLNNKSIIDYWWKLKRNGYNTEKALVEVGFSNGKMIADTWISIIENFSWCFLDNPFEDSLVSLKYLKNNLKFNIRILTSRTSSLQVTQSIYRFGFDRYIDDVIIVNPKKGFEGKASYLSRLKPLIYIGDTELDYSAAIKSTVRFIALSRGQRSNEFLSRLNNIQIENNLDFLYNNDFIKNLLINE